MGNFTFEEMNLMCRLGESIKRGGQSSVCDV